MTAPAVTLSQLESHLWEAANILRGPVDAADFKTYVFPLLFFKRISDVHDEEYQTALAEADGDEEYARFPQNYRFQIGDDCHWNDVRAVASNVGQALQRAKRGIEKANPETLYGIFGDASWTNKDRLPDSLLRDLIEHFSRINLGNQAAQADILGQSYEYLIKKFADATNKKAGEFYTPPARLMSKPSATSFCASRSSRNVGNVASPLPTWRKTSTPRKSAPPSPPPRKSGGPSSGTPTTPSRFSKTFP